MGSERTKAPWPEKNANKVFSEASKKNHKSAMDTWYKVRDSLFGDMDWVESAAEFWGKNSSMKESEEILDSSLENLSAYWQGGAFDAYSRYSMNSAKRIFRNEGVLNEISSVMEGCIDIIYGTYADALEFMADCAHALGDAAQSFIGDLLDPRGEVAAILKALNDFVKAIDDLITKQVRKMGELREKGLFLARQANDFSDVQKMSDPVGDPDLWQVKPKPKEPAA